MILPRAEVVSARTLTVMVHELLLLCDDSVCTVSTTDRAFCFSLTAFDVITSLPAKATLQGKKNNYEEIKHRQEEVGGGYSVSMY